MQGTGNSPVMDRYSAWDSGNLSHAAGAFGTEGLRQIERHLPQRLGTTAETGCGKSTILFSNLSERHYVFTFDDTSLEHSSVNFYRDCPITRRESIVEIFGPTQRTIPPFEHKQRYDVVLLDGAHGWPFPELEYYFFYPHIIEGGLLILDDVRIPTIARMADVLAEDTMWELGPIIGLNTVLFTRTSAPLFDPYADGWWTQPYNRRRVSTKRDIFLAEATRPKDKVSSLDLDARAFGDTPRT